jgi:hypothetical protein
MGEIRDSYEVGKFGRKVHLEDLGVDGRAVLKCGKDL